MYQDHSTNGPIAIGHVTKVIGGGVPETPAGVLHALRAALAEEDVGDDRVARES